MSMDERRAHAVEIQETAERHSVQRAEIDRRAEEFDAYDPQIRPGA
jgi:predicted lipase